MRAATYAALAAIALSTAASPGTSARRAPDGRRLPMQTDTFTTYLARGSDTIRIGFVIDQLERQGDRVVRVYKSEDQVEGKLLDSIVDEQSGLRPVSHVQHSSFFRAAVAFTPSGVAGWRLELAGDSMPVGKSFSGAVYDGVSFDLFVRASDLANGAELEAPFYLIEADSVAVLHASVSGPAAVNGRACWVVRASFAGTPVTFWVDTATRALRRQALEVRQGTLILASGPVDPREIPAIDSDAWTRGLALYNQNQLQPAVPLLLYASLDSPSVGRRLDWAAETVRRLGAVAGAVALARRASRLGPCDAFADEVLGAAFNPQFTSWDSVNYDSTWTHLKHATSCDSNDGNAWILLWGEALRRDDTGLAQDAVRHLYTTGFLTPGLLELARWTLASAPAGAVVLAGGDVDTYGPLAVQTVEAFRPDVKVVNQSMLQLPWYALRVEREVDLPLPLSADSLRAEDRQGDIPQGLGDSVVALWRRLAVSGKLGRVLLFPITNPPKTSGMGLGRLRLIGPVRQVVADADSVDVDTAATRQTLASLRPSLWVGPMISAQDRSPLRRATSLPPVIYPVHVFALYADALLHAGRTAASSEAFRTAQGFGTAAGLDSARVLTTFESVDSALHQ